MSAYTNSVLNGILLYSSKKPKEIRAYYIILSLEWLG